MKTNKIIILALALMAFIGLQSCSGPEGPQGPQGKDGYLEESEVIELQGINLIPVNGDVRFFKYSVSLTPKIKASDVILVYRMDYVDGYGRPVWTPIPRTFYLNLNSNLLIDYDFDFTYDGFNIYAVTNFNVVFSSEADIKNIRNQTFRVVIVPGDFSKIQYVNTTDYNTVIKTYNIDESKIQKIQSK